MKRIWYSRLPWVKRPASRIASLAAALLFCPVFLFAGLIHQDHPPFAIYFDSDDRVNALHLMEILDAQSDRLARLLGARVDPPLDVYLCDSQEQFDALTSGQIPHWGQAVADVARRRIVIKSPALEGSFPYDLDAVVAHELVHILVHQLTGGALVQRWFNEGLAQFLAAEKDEQGRLLISRALSTDSYIPIDRIDDVLEFNVSKARLAYAEGRAAVDFMSTTWGYDTLINILRSTRERGSFFLAFRAELNVSLTEFDRLLKNHLEQKYRWSFLQDFDFFLWTGILVLFLIGFVVVRWRNRRTMQRWTREEPVDYDWDEWRGGNGAHQDAE